jgi:hypothetical protein
MGTNNSKNNPVIVLDGEKQKICTKCNHYQSLNNYHKKSKKCNTCHHQKYVNVDFIRN